MRRILHIDMDAFFAAVEEKRRPELKGKPVVIGGSGDPAERGVVSTANYEARRFGVHSAMPLRTAYKLCPGCVFLPVDYGEYSRVSAIIKGILRKFSPVMEDVGIDEAFLDISDVPQKPPEIAKAVKEAVFRATGLTCSVGVAPNKLLAKIASDLDKPDGLTIIGEGDVKRVLDPLPVRKLWGVGPKTEKYLKDAGIDTVGELSGLPLDELTERFGQSYGHYLYEASRGIDRSPLVTEWKPKSASREVTLQRDTGQWQQVARTLAGLSKGVASDLKERGLKGKSVTVKIRFGDFKTHTRVRSLPSATDSYEEIRKAAFEALSRFELKGVLPARKVRLIGVRVGGVEETDSPLR